MSDISALSNIQMPVQMPDVKLPTLNADNQTKLKKAAKEFEGVFMDIVMKSMRETVGKSDLFGDEEKSNFFQGMLDTEYSKISAAKSKMGLADAIVRQMSKTLVEQPKAVPAAADVKPTL